MKRSKRNFDWNKITISSSFPKLTRNKKVRSSPRNIKQSLENVLPQIVPTIDFFSAVLVKIKAGNMGNHCSSVVIAPACLSDYWGAMGSYPSRWLAFLSFYSILSIMFPLKDLRGALMIQNWPTWGDSGSDVLGQSFKTLLEDNGGIDSNVFFIIFRHDI